MCCAVSNGRPEDKVGTCKSCGEDVDANGDFCGEDCYYSPSVCDDCGYRPCDGSC